MQAPAARPRPETPPEARRLPREPSSPYASSRFQDGLTSFRIVANYKGSANRAGRGNSTGVSGRSDKQPFCQMDIDAGIRPTLSRRKRIKRLTLERRKKENPRNAAWPQTGARTLSKKNDPKV